MDFQTSIKVHPTALFNIVHSFERRKEDAKRVIGTLLGSIHGNTVEVTSCFCVPHNESKDEVAVDMEFARSMTDFHTKANPNEVIVGWYATGLEISAYSVLIHEYYCRETKNPIHLVMDTDVQSGSMDYKCYVASSIGVPGDAKKGNLFKPVKSETIYYDCERVTIDTITRLCDKSIEEKGVQRETVMKLQSDFGTVLDENNKLQQLLNFVNGYVDKVLAGEVPMNPKIGRMLMDIMKKIPYMEEQDFSAMLQNNLTDNMTVRYLTSILKTQVSLNEKLVNTSTVVKTN